MRPFNEKIDNCALVAKKLVTYFILSCSFEKKQFLIYLLNNGLIILLLKKFSQWFELELETIVGGDDWPCIHSFLPII